LTNRDHIFFTGGNSNSIKKNTDTLQVKEEPAIGVVCGDDSAAEIHSWGEHLRKQDGICRVFEALPFGRSISVPVGSWSESAPLELSCRREPDETCTSAGSAPVLLAYQATVLSLVLSNQIASR